MATSLEHVLSLVSHARRVDNPLGNVAMFINQYDLYVKVGHAISLDFEAHDVALDVRLNDHDGARTRAVHRAQRTGPTS